MRAPLSIVIPTLNAAPELAGTLPCLIEGLERGVIRELIISDGGSTDETRSLADSAGAEWVTGAAGRGGQLARGAEVAKGDWLLFLHADTQLEAGWADAVLTHIGTSKAGYFKLAFRADGVWPSVVARLANIRSRMGLPYGDQGLLISSDLYHQIGGYRDIPLMEDVDIIRRLSAQIAPIPIIARTSAARYQKNGWLRTSLGNLWTLARYFSGVAPAKLARRYYS